MVFDPWLVSAGLLTGEFPKDFAVSESVPQRLKPRTKQVTYGTAKAVPLSKADFFSSLPRAVGFRE